MCPLANETLLSISRRESARRKPIAVSASSLWAAVQEQCRRAVGEEPAIREQGAVRIARALYDACLAR